MDKKQCLNFFYYKTKINNYIVVGFGPTVFKHTVGVNAYFSPGISYHAFLIPDYILGDKKYIIDYYRKSFCCTENLAITRLELKFA